MKRNTVLGLCFLITLNIYTQNFADFFQNKTLRIDYIFTGDAKRQSIYLDELSRLPSWSGRQHLTVGCVPMSTLRSVPFVNAPFAR